ncbi:MAG TPA: NAD(P)/FAD-dependent oxidoreductase [Terriglobales bacterium]|nr:NAD(P)/FAD-dependent oxidoreductase [Terriglobales bacterium]
MNASPVIIGGGPAGLTAAYELSKLGMGSTVLEADDQVGGLSRTVSYRGYRFDIGGHRFFSKVPLINEVWREILGDQLLIRPRLSRIHYDGKFFDYPLKPLNALLGLGPVETLLVCLSYARAQLSPAGDETSFESWVSNRFGTRLYEIFFKTYTEKVWGIPCSEISADWAAQRIKNLSLREAVRNALLSSARASDGQVITSLIERFQYPRLGPGMMWEQCEQLLAQRSVPTLRGLRVERIRHERGRVVAVFARDNHGELVELPASHCISSMPIRELIHALDPAPPAEVLAAAAGLRYRDYLTVVLILQRPEVFPDNWIYIHSPEVKLGRIQNYKNWSPEMVPDSSKTSLGLEYFLWEGDEEWTWSTERLLELGTRECSRIGLIDPSEVDDGTIVRMQKAYPIYDQSYRRNLDTVRSYLGQIDNLQLIGRNGQHRYNNQDHSMLTGIYAARNLAAGANYDVWSVNVEEEYHEQASLPATSGDRLFPQRIAAVPDPAIAVSERLLEEAFAPLDAVALAAAFAVVAAFGLFLATSALLLKGGALVGPNLALLGQYLIGYSVSWQGALIGSLEAAVVAGAAGYSVARLRNWGVAAYAALLRRRAEAEQRRNMLDQV